MYVGVLKKTGVALGILLAVWVGFKFLFPIALPFILAWLVALCLQPAVRLMSKRFSVSKRPIAGVFVAVTVLGLGTLAFLAVSRLVSEAGKLIFSLSESANGGMDSFFDTLNGFLERVPFLSALGGDISELVEGSLREIFSKITASIPSMVAYVIGAIPGFFLFAVVLIMASYYFAADYDEIKKNVYSFLPVSVRRAWDRFKRRLMGAGVQYLKSCLILAFITFAELLVGFLTLGVPYAFTLAVIIALVDMLPILGSGTVLVPWAIWEWITGDTYYAIGIMIIFAVVTVVRRFAEPRIISSGIGLSPITTLLSMYIGFRFFGLGGLFLAPLFAVLTLSALPEELAEKLGMRCELSEADQNTNDVKKAVGG